MKMNSAGSLLTRRLKCIGRWVVRDCWNRFTKEAMAWELSQNGLQIQREEPSPIRYKGQLLATPLKIDLIVNQTVIIECKATSKYHPVFEAQALTYLRLTGMKLAFVINFGERLVKDGIHRVVNGL